MFRTRWTWLANLGLLLAGLLVTGSAHAATGQWKRYFDASYPSSGTNKGKYASAWVDVYTNDCTNVAKDIDACYETKGVASGRVLNAGVIEALYGKAYARHRTPGTQDLWDWGYSVRAFGKTIASQTASVTSAQVLMNVAQSMPLETNDFPFTIQNAIIASFDLSEISEDLGILPDALLGVDFKLGGGVSTELNVFPKSGYGSFVTARVMPRGSMTAYTYDTYSIGPVTATLKSEGNVQVIAPSSNVDINATYSFNSGIVDVTESHYLRLLKGQVSYLIEILGIDVDDGAVWSQTASYMKYFTDGAVNTIYSGTLPFGQPALP